ncbi:imidazole glycerol phosphate synthase subunit HisH [Sporolactobacillus sp. Y61]|jgi:glutamine amidotransferase|uniref:Imidazole glycerol phosphate synthase subunit HisH n=1 Tax=Sporolactobacillus sp. Y61 TaxID=3160863 RepID=A0AAU8IEV5_9BACL|nr:imidazole glycerol phosphate synthase subunit HisH [Sporolactobacillus sp. THM19-2]RYL94581.1 imidazole glycerol phosphate synthase subunit HisH [Sporolactobacillus sp. THM19-2]
MIGIVDYGMGNLYSLGQALKRIGTPFFISDNEQKLEEADGLILPGVGAFKDAMALLNRKRLTPFLQDVAQRKPLLGICLGMQLLFEESEEGGTHKGLGLLPGRVVRFSGMDEGLRYKVPHMGWNTLSFKQPESPLLHGLSEDYAYFVHSYYAVTDAPVLIAVTSYHVDVPAIVGHGFVSGTQFHPEKSGAFGQTLLKNYLQFVQHSVSAQKRLSREGI